MEVEVEGSNSTLIQSINNLANIVGRGNGVTQPRGSRATNGKGVALGAADEDVDEDDNDSTIEQKPVVSAPRSRVKRAVSSPEILELDFASGQMPLKTFVGEKKPDGDSRRYLVIAYWFKHYYRTPNVTVAHIHMAWPRFRGHHDRPPSEVGKNGDSWEKQGGNFRVNTSSRLFVA